MENEPCKAIDRIYEWLKHHKAPRSLWGDCEIMRNYIAENNSFRNQILPENYGVKENFIEK